MDLYNLPEISRDNAVLYYTGSFDPAHEGHKSALKAAMEKIQAIGAVVVISEGENVDKPNRSSWEVRRQIALEVFGESDQILVSPWTKDKAKKDLLERAYVINLMGVDIWEKYCKRSKTDFQGICVCLRNGEEADYTTNLKDKEIVYIKPEVIGCSSSKIRDYLKEHPELYEGVNPSPGTILDLLPLKAFEYIIENKIYYQPNQTSEHLLQEQVS